MMSRRIMNMSNGRTSIVHSKQIFNGKATKNPLLFMSPSINDNYDPQNQKYVKERR
jgi:hypothetical protein